MRGLTFAEEVTLSTVSKIPGQRSKAQRGIRLPPLHPWGALDVGDGVRQTRSQGGLRSPDLGTYGKSRQLRG